MRTIGDHFPTLHVKAVVGLELRVLDALQTDELWPCNWHKGEPTLTAA